MCVRFVLVVLVLAAACTNDYESLRFPTVAATADAGDGGIADGG